MAGHLYAVIFEQGTTKVGMTRGTPSVRVRAHYSEGAKWGIKVKYELSTKFDDDSLEFKELSLCGYCGRFALSVSSYEWFRFKDPEEAKTLIEMFFEKIKAGDFGAVQCRRNDPKLDKEVRFNAAMALIKNGMSPYDAAKKVNLHPKSVNQKKEFLMWKEQMEREHQMMINGATNA